MLYTNPLLSSGPDPYIIYKDGFYYYTDTTHSNIAIRKTSIPVQLQDAEHRIVWEAPSNFDDVWSPEIHFISGAWFIYFAATVNSGGHRMMVLMCNGDPMKDKWEFIGKITTPDDKWSIDGTVLEHNGSYYFIWSGWPDDYDYQQNLYIAKMGSPTQIEGYRVCISKPEFWWERHTCGHPVYVNEGAAVLKKDNKVFVVYSASGCWTDFYCLGILELSGDPMDSKAWIKYPKPVFKQGNGVYATGHNSFFQSPSGQDYILYHGNPNPNQGCEDFRSPRAQPFNWENGMPVFGEPTTDPMDY